MIFPESAYGNLPPPKKTHSPLSCHSNHLAAYPANLLIALEGIINATLTAPTIQKPSQYIVCMACLVYHL